MADSRGFLRGFELPYFKLPYLIYVFGQTGLSKQCRSRSAPQNAASDQGLHFLPPPAILHTFTGGKMDLLKISVKKNVPNISSLSKIPPPLCKNVLAEHAFDLTTFFFYFCLFCCAYSLSVKLFNCIIKSAAVNTCVLMQLSITFVARFTCKPVQGMTTKQQSHVVPNTAIIIMTPV